MPIFLKTLDFKSAHLKGPVIACSCQKTVLQGISCVLHSCGERAKFSPLHHLQPSHFVVYVLRSKFNISYHCSFVFPARYIFPSWDCKLQIWVCQKCFLSYCPTCYRCKMVLSFVLCMPSQEVVNFFSTYGQCAVCISVQQGNVLKYSISRHASGLLKMWNIQ